MAKDFGNRWRSDDSQPSEGGQAHIFRVTDLEHPDTGTFALKRLKKAQDASRIARFKAEISALAALDHPGIVKVLDEGTEGGQPYFVMPYFARGNLSDNRALVAATHVDAVRTFAKICDAVAVAHSKGIVHRDIKPENILLTDNHEPVVSDFGLCYIRDTERQTQMKEAVGARWYMAPELAHGRAVESQITPRCDVYSLGKLLYNLISNDIFDREVHRDTTFNLVNQFKSDELEHVNRILDRSVVQDPSARCQDAGELALLAHEAARLMDGKFRIISSAGGQLCTFCGAGRYEIKPEGFVEHTRYQGQEWRFLVCSECGHLLQFRIEKAARKKDWLG